LGLFIQRDRITLPTGLSEGDARVVLSNKAVKRCPESKEPKRVIVVLGKLVNVEV